MEDNFLTNNMVHQGLLQIIKDFEEKLAAKNASNAKNEDQDKVNPFWVQPHFDVAELEHGPRFLSKIQHWGSQFHCLDPILALYRLRDQ
ncbi:hypothetical protein FRC07_004358, partial [Ceratobasidium sp. 392]